MPIEIDKIEVHLDFHVFAILDFDLLIGYSFENLFQEKNLPLGALMKSYEKLLSPLISLV
jgi:hypothetical protein